MAATHTGFLAIMTEKGDVKQYWDASNPAEVEIARQLFEEYRSKGYTAARMDGTSGEILKQFDPSAGSIVIFPPLSGG